MCQSKQRVSAWILPIHTDITGSEVPGVYWTKRGVSMNEEKVIEIALCEVDWIFLRPNQLYRFVPIPGCEACQLLALQYKSGE
jgi:hypothetical protein